MSEKRLIIHPGFHKSGTTALQESFALNRPLLRENGIFYPPIGSKAHHRVAWALTQRPWGWNRRGGERTPEKYWDRMASRINGAKEETVILSSEFFSEIDGERIRKIRSDIKGRDIQILFTLRPLAKLLPSSYQQYLKYGITVEYEDWLHAILDKPGESKVSPTFWKRHSHGKVVARWVDIFSKSNVTLLIVNEAQPTFLFDEINKFLNLPTGTLNAAPSGSNRSLTMEEISLLLELNRQFPKERVWDEYEVFVRAGYIRHLTDHVPPAADKARLLTPQWAVDKANELGKVIQKELLGTGVKIIGDVDSLGNSVVPIGTSSYTDSIDIKTVAAAMMVFDKETINRMPLGWLKSNLILRLRKRLKRSIKR
jgi:sugar-specific transcriptional regulator TrmB